MRTLRRGLVVEDQWQGDCLMRTLWRGLAVEDQWQGNCLMRTLWRGLDGDDRQQGDCLVEPVAGDRIQGTGGRGPVVEGPDVEGQW